MNRLNSILLGGAALLLIAVPARGSLAQFQGKPDAEGVYPEALVNAGGTPTTLKLIGYATRKKYLTIFSKSVYEVASYADAQEIARSKARLLTMKMLMNLSAAQVRNSFIEGMSNNGIDVTSPPIQHILNAFNSGSKTDDLIQMVGYSKEGTEFLAVEMSRGGQIVASIQEKAPHLVQDIWKVWCGDPEKADKGIREMQTMLCGKTGQL